MSSLKVARLIPLALLIASLSACGCGGNEEAAQMIRGLSKQRLARLFQDVKALDTKRGKAAALIFTEDKHNIPGSFADLKPKFIAINGDLSRVHLSGCVDDKVYLYFSGIDSDHRPEIVLGPGEVQPAEVVWQSE